MVARGLLELKNREKSGKLNLIILLENVQETGNSYTRMSRKQEILEEAIGIIFLAPLFDLVSFQTR